MKTTFLRNTFFYLALVVGTATVFTACKPEDGDVGPKGIQGEAGPAGPAGDKGVAGSSLNKGGFITGTITGKGKDGVTPINETFRLEYTSDNGPLLFEEQEGVYYFVVVRTDSSAASNMELIFSTPLDFSSARFYSADLSFHKKVSETQYKYLAGDVFVYGSTVTPPGHVTKFNYDRSTGILSGDYTYTLKQVSTADEGNGYGGTSSTGQPLTVTGSFSIVARKGVF
jgi:hypothetical protein